MKTTRCTQCREEFTDEEVTSSVCPSCGTSSVPMAIADDVQVQINWHELRILGMWAENWAVSHDNAQMVKTVRTIARLVEQQFPGKPSITLSGEFRDLREALPDIAPGSSMQISDPRFYVPSGDSGHREGK